MASRYRGLNKKLVIKNDKLDSSREGVADGVGPRWGRVLNKRMQLQSPCSQMLRNV